MWTLSRFSGRFADRLSAHYPVWYATAAVVAAIGVSVAAYLLVADDFVRTSTLADSQAGGRAVHSTPAGEKLGGGPENFQLDPLFARGATASSPTLLSVTAVAPALPTRFKLATTSVFWVGEEASADNGQIHNLASAFDEDWVGHFGGEDDPDDRCGYLPCDFTPKQSAFYVALPYSDLDDFGNRKFNAAYIPWYDGASVPIGSMVEGHWLEIHRGNRICFAQWRDVGPYQTDDFAYVFGSASRPKNTVDLQAGLDVSPAVRDCLGFTDDAFTAWRFVDAAQVPEGPWHLHSQH